MMNAFQCQGLTEVLTSQDRGTMGGNSTTPAFLQEIPKSSYKQKNHTRKAVGYALKPREKGVVLGVTRRSAGLSLKQVHNTTSNSTVSTGSCSKDYKKGILLGEEFV